MYEIIGKVTGGGFTAQVTIGPYKGEPPTRLLHAVRESLAEKFYEWTGSHAETVVVTSSANRQANG